MAPRSLSLPFDNNMSTPPHLRPHLGLVLAVVLRALARRLEANAQPPAGTGSQLDIGLAIRQLRDAALSPTTRKAYAGALRRYDDWLAGRAPSDRLLAKYLDVLFHNGLAPASAALTVAAVRRAVRDLARARHDCAEHPVGPVALERLARFRREASERGRGQAPPLLWEDADKMSECAETRGDARGIRDAEPQGLTQMLMGNVDAAEVSLARAATLDPSYPQAQFNLGVLRFGQGRHRDAITLFQQTLVLDPGFADAYINPGSAYAALEEYEATLEPWQRLRQIQPDNAALIHNIALANARLGRLGLAIADFQRVLELDPGNTASRRELSLLRNRAATRNTSP